MWPHCYWSLSLYAHVLHWSNEKKFKDIKKKVEELKVEHGIQDYDAKHLKSKAPI
jgi:hypothetical protein